MLPKIYNVEDIGGKSIIWHVSVSKLTKKVSHYRNNLPSGETSKAPKVHWLKALRNFLTFIEIESDVWNPFRNVI